MAYTGRAPSAAPLTSADINDGAVAPADLSTGAPSWTAGGAVTLPYNGSNKLATTSTGIDVTGTVTADGLTVDTTASNGVTITASDNLTTNYPLKVQNAAGTGRLELSTYGINNNIDLKLQTQGTNAIYIDTNKDISFYEDTGTTAKFFWDASAESLGIGTSSLITAAGRSSLTISTAAEKGELHLQNRTATTSSDAGVLTYYNGSNRIGSIQSTADGATNSGRFIFYTYNAGSPTRAMDIDSSGNLLVGKTATGTNTAGVEARPIGLLAATRSGGNPLILNRQTSDGAIINFEKDGTTVGSIGAYGGNLHITGPSKGIKFEPTQFIPRTNTDGNADNTVDLGGAFHRWDDIYATNGTIQTSDRNEKQDIEELSEAEQRVAIAAKGLLRKYRWKASVAEKGDEARIHFGIIAQDLQAAFEAEGLDAGRYGMFIHSTWWETYTDVPAVEAVEAVYETQTDEEGNEVQVLVSEAVEAKEGYTRTDTHDEPVEGATEKSRMGIRYPELLAFIIAAI